MNLNMTKKRYMKEEEKKSNEQQNFSRLARSSKLYRTFFHQEPPTHASRQESSCGEMRFAVLMFLELNKIFVNKNTKVAANRAAMYLIFQFM